MAETSTTKHPFAEAAKTTFSHKTDDGASVYKGVLDPFWAVSVVPHGGYVLALIVDALIHHQAGTNQPDPIHLSTHYLEPNKPAACEIVIRVQRTGRRYSNLTADLYQNGRMNVTSHVIVGNLPDPANLTVNPAVPSLLPPHPLAPRTPFRTHPSVAKLTKKPKKLTFRFAFDYAIDPAVAERHARDGEQGFGERNESLDDASWYELLDETDKDARVGFPAIVWLSDMGRNTPSLLTGGLAPGESWFPTMSFQLEFKVKLSALPAYIAPQTFGVWTTGRFVMEGRHEVHTEIWTAPSKIGQSGAISAEDPSWRDKMFCIARSSQMALTIPLEVNTRKGKKEGEGEKAKL